MTTLTANNQMNDHQGEMHQQSLPLAFVRGEQVLEKPKELYIPEQALAVQLANFEGPLDLLLYLIKKQKFDIADLPIAPITAQYLIYLEKMKEQGIDLAADYLVMAATLAEIKSRLLLPAPVIDEEEQDPRAELMRKLEEYQSIKEAASWLEQQPQIDRDIFVAKAEDIELKKHATPTADTIVLSQLVDAFRHIMKRQAAYEHHHIERELISCKDKMSFILSMLEQQPLLSSDFIKLIVPKEGRQGIVVTFMAVLELLKEQAISITLEAEHSMQKHSTFLVEKSA